VDTPPERGRGGTLLFLVNSIVVIRGIMRKGFVDSIPNITLKTTFLMLARLHIKNYI